MSDQATIDLEPKLQTLVKELDGLTLLEASKIVKYLEGHWGVSAAAPAAVAAPAGGGGAAPAAEEKTSFDVVLAAAGQNKIPVIKVIREITGLGLKEAKAVADEAPKPVKEGVTREEADQIKAKLEEVGATVEVN